MSEGKHTALPFSLDEKDYDTLQITGRPNGFCADIVVRAHFGNREDAAFIVTACNSHYQLLEALEDARDCVFVAGLPGQLENLDAAIKAARGEA